MSVLLAPLTLVFSQLDPTPEPADIKAGWVGFALFLILLVAIGLLGWSLSRHLRRTDENRKAGVFGDESARDPDAHTHRARS